MHVWVAFTCSHVATLCYSWVSVHDVHQIPGHCLNTFSANRVIGFWRTDPVCIKSIGHLERETTYY